MTAAGVGKALQRAAWSCDVDFTIYSRSYILVYGTEKQLDFKLDIERPISPVSEGAQGFALIMSPVRP